MLKRVVELIKNTDEFTPIEKDEGIATIVGYGEGWTRKNAVRVLSVMEKDKAYRCKDLTPIITGHAFKMYDQCCMIGLMRALVKAGAIRREVVVTGREIEIPNPKRNGIRQLERDIAYYNERLTFYNPRRDWISQSDYRERIMWCEQKLEQLKALPTTIKVKEKITYFYKTY
jgi:hypothetical protein